jgi:hypothetical protein
MDIKPRLKPVSIFSLLSLSAKIFDIIVAHLLLFSISTNLLLEDIHGSGLR